MMRAAHRRGGHATVTPPADRMTREWVLLFVIVGAFTVIGFVLGMTLFAWMDGAS